MTGKEFSDTDAWRSQISADLAEAKERMQDMERQHKLLQTAVSVNTDICNDVKKNTDEIVEFFEAGKGTFKFFKMVGGIAKWFTAVSVAAAAFYMMAKGGK